jgi:arsenite oxidase small subunit
VKQDGSMTRRDFNKLCVAAASLLSAPGAFAGGKTVLHNYDRVRLVSPSGPPISPNELEAGVNYIFHYPFITTPCFLIDLGIPAHGGQALKTEDGRHYRWQGGVGPQRSIVAFSAICAHMMTHPARAVSFINYRHRAVTFVNAEDQRTRQSQVIYCCSEKSVYDATRGAKVLGGPAPQPLAVILLEYDDAAGALYAVGTAGGEMFDRFFGEYSFRLKLEYKISDARTRITGTTTVMPLSEFCENQVRC